METLSKEEKAIISESYGVKAQTRIPSLYDQTTCEFRQESDLSIVDEDNFYPKIKKGIPVKKNILGRNWKKKFPLSLLKI